jgi:beta-xylosidase
MKKKAFVSGLVTALCILGLCTQSARAWQSDNGDGTFTNPPLYADYPDPDIIRVGEDFYFATTTFVNSPGLKLLHSKDLVNWEIVSNVVTRLDGDPKYDMNGGTSYRHGIFAPSLRYHNGTFYIAVTPVGQSTRIYRSRDPKGPWICKEIGEQAFDPGMYIEPDGKAYIITSGSWDGTITLLTLNDDLSRVVRKEKIYYIKGAEGSKVVKRGDWYYLFNAIPSRLGMTVSRAKNLTGKWETIKQIDTASGGHQGALVDLPDGTYYGFAHRDSGAIGRMTQISPVYWENDWPVWGTREHPMQIPSVVKKPVQGCRVMQPVASDNFSTPALGLQWAWNHNPDNSRWSLTARPGFLRLMPTKATGFWTARNTLTQKGQGPWSRGDVILDLSHLKPGDICGFGTLGKFSGHIAVSCDKDGKLSLGMEVVEDTKTGLKTDVRVTGIPVKDKQIHLRADMDFVTDKCALSYSFDGRDWLPLGGAFELAYDWQTGTFQGPQYAIFCYNPDPSDGFLDVDSFTFTDKK